MIKLGKISPLAFSHMKRRGISIDGLNHLLAHGQVEKQFDGSQLVYLDIPTLQSTSPVRPTPRLYAVVDAVGDVLTVERRIRLKESLNRPHLSVRS
ncbi:MAG: hypothetical protein ABL877_02635 [Thiobacillus sp.]